MFNIAEGVTQKVSWLVSFLNILALTLLCAPRSMVRPGRGDTGPMKQTTEVGMGGVGNMRREKQKPTRNNSERPEHP